MRQGAEDTLRFVVNSSVGVAGLFDVASRMGLPAHDEDFGQTLGVWGWTQKPICSSLCLGLALTGTCQEFPSLQLSIRCSGSAGLL